MAAHLATLPPMHSLPRPIPASRLRAAASVLTLASVLGCTSGPKTPPPPKRPLSEHRALQLISQVVRTEGRSPVKGSYIDVGTDTPLKVDVGVGTLGIAYLTPQELDGYAAALPQLKKKRSSLLLVSGGEGQAYVKVLVLTAQDYAFDEYRGTERTISSVAAESRLRRDVLDFVVQARARGWEIPDPKAAGAEATGEAN